MKRDLQLTRLQLSKIGANANMNGGGGGGGDGAVASNGASPAGQGMEGGGAGVGAGHATNGAGGPQSATASEASSSWEAVDEKESQPTLWVPDHAAQTCSR